MYFLRMKFGRVAYLLDQEARTGGLAVLEDGKRFIYYLVTKERSQGKPTMYTLWLSLKKLKDHCIEHDVKKLAIPQIGCGLDRLIWSEVKQLLEYVFKDVDIEIVVYTLEGDVSISSLIVDLTFSVIPTIIMFMCYKKPN